MSKGKSTSTRTTDLSKRQFKIEKLKLKSAKNRAAAEIEKERIKGQTRIALGGEAGATVTGSVASGIGYSSVNQSIDKTVNGGMTDQGGLGRDEANSNNDPDKT